MNSMTRLEPAIRDNNWLIDRLADIWYRYFPDIEQTNKVIIQFGRRSRTRLGSICMSGWRDQVKSAPKGTSVITITGYFKNPVVPIYVIEATIGHELVHYAHGFHSPRPQLYRYPHQGGVVDKELRQRAMGEILKQQRSWLKKEWPLIIRTKATKPRRKYARLSFLSTYWR